MRLVTMGLCALAVDALLGIGLDSQPAQANPRQITDRGANHLAVGSWPAANEPAPPGGNRLLAGARAERPGALQIVFVDGSSVRLGPANLAKLDGFARAAGGTDGRSDPTLEDGIVRLKSGSLRRWPVLLSGQSANAHASLAVHAAMQGDSETAQSALRRAKADVGDVALQGGQGWASISRAHVNLAEAQLLDLDGRHEEAEFRYRAGLAAIAVDGEAMQNGSAAGAPDGVADAQVLLAAELSRSLARNLAVQGRRTESQVAARHSVRTYVERFGHAPAYASSGLNGAAAAGVTQVAVSQVPGGAVVGQMLLTGVLIVTAIGPETGEDDVKDARGDPMGTVRSPGPSDDSGTVREPSGTAGGTDRSDNGAGGNGTSRETSGTAGGTDRSANGTGTNGTSREASGEAGGTSRSADGSGSDGKSRGASGGAGGTGRSADGSGDGDASRDASGTAGGTSRSADASGASGASRKASGKAR